MSDSHNHDHDPFTAPEPQRFDAEAYDPHSSVPPSEPAPLPIASVPGLPPMPEVPADPLLPSDPASAVAAPNDRLALDGTSLWLNRLGEELVAWLKTLASAAVYATLIVTFGFQVARVEGMSMAPTLQDQDRLIVNKLEYRLPNHSPRVGDIVMLLWPNDPEKSFVKRVVAEPGGAAAFAALLSGRYRPAPGERVAVLVCGANTTAVNFETSRAA